MEMLGARHVWLHGKNSFSYSIMTIIEETMEMSGIGLFIYALLNYLKTRTEKIEIHFK